MIQALMVRDPEGRETSSSAGVIDSQSVKGAEKGARIDRPGYDAGNKVKGKKRHLLVDTLSLILAFAVGSRKPPVRSAQRGKNLPRPDETNQEFLVNLS